MKKHLILASAICFCLGVSAQELASPDGKFKMNFSVDASGRPTYTLAYGEKTVIAPSHLGYQLKPEDPSKMTDFDWKTPAAAEDAVARRADLQTGFTIDATTYASFDELWHPVWGEESTIRNHYNEMVVHLSQQKNDRKMDIRFRLFDDGLGFRYEFPDQKNLTYFTIKEEKTEFALTGDHKAWWIAGDYDTQEYEWQTTRLSGIAARMKEAVAPNSSQTPAGPASVQTSLQMKTDDGLYINLHEAACIDYATMHLDYDQSNNCFTSHLTPSASGD